MAYQIIFLLLDNRLEIAILPKIFVSSLLADAAPELYVGTPAALNRYYFGWTNTFD